MSNSLFNKMFVHSLSSQFVLPERNDTVLENLLIINMILSRSMSMTDSIRMKLIMIMLND